MPTSTTAARINGAAGSAVSIPNRGLEAFPGWGTLAIASSRHARCRLHESGALCTVGHGDDLQGHGYADASGKQGSLTTLTRTPLAPRFSDVAASRQCLHRCPHGWRVQRHDGLQLIHLPVLTAGRILVQRELLTSNAAEARESLSTDLMGRRVVPADAVQPQRQQRNRPLSNDGSFDHEVQVGRRRSGSRPARRAATRRGMVRHC